MKVSISIPDELYDELTKKAGSPLKLSEHINWTLATFGADVSRFDRFIMLKGKDRQAVEAVFQTTVANVEDLLLKLRRLALFKMGPVERILDVNELAVLKEQAAFHGKDTEAYLAFVANDVIDRTLGRI